MSSRKQAFAKLYTVLYTACRLIGIRQIIGMCISRKKNIFYKKIISVLIQIQKQFIDVLLA